MAPLILIPGLLCDRRLWSNQIANLEKQTDISVADITRHSSVEEMATNLLHVAPKRFALAGFSLGSQVALEIINIAPERVERLALLSATHGGPLPAVATAIHQAINVIERGDFDKYLDAVYPTYFAASRADNLALKQTFISMAHTVGPVTGLRQMRALLAIRGPFNMLDQIKCPTHIIGGREDHRTTPEAHESLAREIPGSKLAIIDGAAHFTPLERPKEVSFLLEDWLNH
jgi:pimeloyl-ACP methyl ester carboxylesterase